MNKIIIIISFFYFLLAYHLNAAYNIKTSIDRSTINIGDIITYTILIEFDKDIKLELPPPGAELGQFDIKDFNITDQKSDNKDIIKKKIEYKITIYELGEFEIPTIEIGLIDKNNERHNLTTEPLLIKVEPLKRLPTDTDDIRDLKRPIFVPTYTIFYIIGILLFLALLYYGYQYYLKNLKKVKEEVKNDKTQHIPEDELALSKIKLLGEKDYLKKMQYKNFYFELSEIIREYLNKRYNILTLERTTYEISLDLKKILPEKELLNEFLEFFNECDMVKFAKYIPTLNEIKSIIPRAINLIQKTRRTYNINETV